MTQNEQNEYLKQANEFLKQTKTEFNAVFIEYGLYFDDDKDKRDIWQITLKRGTRSYNFKFGQSIAESGFKCLNAHNENLTPKLNALKDLNYCSDIMTARQHVNLKITLTGLKVLDRTPPTVYDVLTCLQKYEVGTFKDFCAEFGYNDDSIKAHNTYKAVVSEYENLKMLYSDDELNLMAQIQ